jgi:hypothetical protein
MTYPLFQHAYFVNDLEASIGRWHELFGAGPFVITPHHRALTFAYRGTPQEADVSYAFGYLGDVMIQFIQQHDETPSIYRDMYARGQEGFHHVATLVHDYDAARQHYVNLGYEVACELTTADVRAAYFDTRSVTGGFTEIHNDPPRIIGAFASYRHAHQTHQPGDPIFTIRS